ncbi:YwiC-like family protein [Bifidobacterium simiarum]|uniref:YwiC-like family protein n=1 Tax=Bifidobacterium simiarum TaxID=2045441 RepID=UPI001BDBB273|nr:YwiC-like family protein [Bifidobacterium simiarum]MBT1165431.1 YwiC-like family protein [Bifidobacterium simiarum]
MTSDHDNLRNHNGHRPRVAPGTIRTVGTKPRGRNATASATSSASTDPSSAVNPVRLWLPNQHGAWAMVLLPSLAAVVVSGADWRGIWLLLCWALCYCLQFCTARWVKAFGSVKNSRPSAATSSATSSATIRRRADRLTRYRRPVIVYALVLLVFGGIPLLTASPGLLRWAPAYAVLFALSLLAAYLRRERSLWANATAIVASCLMPVLICSVGSSALRRACAFDTSSGTDAQFGACAAEVTRYQSIIAAPANPWDLRSPSYWQSWWPDGSVPAAGLILLVVFALAQFGSVLFVKTMIRERGSRVYYMASVVWHVGLVMAGFAIGSIGSIVGDGNAVKTVVLGCIALALLARAVVTPMIARRRPVKPLIVGIIEIVASLLTFAAAIVVVL